MMRVLLVGFGPFPGAPLNPSASLVKTLARRRRPALAEATLTAHVLKTSYDAVDRDLPALFAQPADIVLIFGLAARRRHLCIETRARNALSVLFPDVSGFRPQRGVIALAGPSARRGTAPFAALLGAARARGFPARMSRDAGRYLCNYAYWHALERTGDGRPLVQFVHLPGVRIDQQKRRRGRRRPFSLQALTVAAEAVLVALMAACRR